MTQDQQLFVSIGRIVGVWHQYRYSEAAFTILLPLNRLNHQ